MSNAKKYLLAAAAWVALCVVGCGGGQPEQANQKPTDQQKSERFERAKKRMPPDATDIKDEGNGWYSFRLARDGTTHKYLTVFTNTGSSTHVVAVTRMD